MMAAWSPNLPNTGQDFTNTRYLLNDGRWVNEIIKSNRMDGRIRISVENCVITVQQPEKEKPP